MTDDLPGPLADGWQPVTTLTDQRQVFVVSISAETTVYEPIDEPAVAGLETALPVRSLFCVDLTFSPSLPAVGITPRAVRSMAAKKARSQFVDLVEDEGLVVDGVRETHAFKRECGPHGTWFVLDALVPLADGDELPAEAHVIVWPTETSFGVVGGTLPLEEPSGERAAVDGQQLTVDPTTDRNRIVRLVSAMDEPPTA